MQNTSHDVHELPNPSLWPILMGFSLTLIAIGVIFSLVISIIGIVLLIATLVGWMLENRNTEVVEEDDV